MRGGVGERGFGEDLVASSLMCPIPEAPAPLSLQAVRDTYRQAQSLAKCRSNGDILLCAASLQFSAPSRGSLGVAGGGTEGCPGSSSGSGAKLEVAPESLGVLPCPGVLIYWPQGKDVGRRVGVRALTSELFSFPRAQESTPQDQGRWRLPRGAWSPWKTIPSTPPGRKVSQRGAGATSAILFPGAGTHMGCT